MGCSTSKQDARNTPLTRSMSLPGSCIDLEGNGKSPCKVNRSEKRLGHNLVPPHSRSLLVLRSGKEGDSSYKCRGTSKRSVSFCEAPEDSAEMKYSQGSENLRSCDGPSAQAGSRTASFAAVDAMQNNSGLRLLLSPLSIPSRSFTSSTTHGFLSKAPCFSGNEKRDWKGMADAQNPIVCRAPSLAIEGMNDSEEPSSPLFDPSILATFERAVEASVDDSHSSDVTSTGCSLDTSSDADSPDWQKGNGSRKVGKRASAMRWAYAENPCRLATDLFSQKVAPGHKHVGALKKKSFSKVTPLINDTWLERDYFEGFEVKCPAGCEDKVVLYFTSLRGVRKTYEDCCIVRLLLKRFGVQVDERDVWMHAKFRDELINIVGAVVNVPRLFVKGRYIGGVEDVKYLSEEGILENLVEGLPAESNLCNVCCGIRFMLCTSCNGSCKLIMSREVYRCPDCNENGLMMCPLCH